MNNFDVELNESYKTLIFSTIVTLLWCCWVLLLFLAFLTRFGVSLSFQRCGIRSLHVERRRKSHRVPSMYSEKKSTRSYVLSEEMEKNNNNNSNNTTKSETKPFPNSTAKLKSNMKSKYRGYDYRRTFYAIDG